MERKLRGIDIVSLLFGSFCVFEAIAGILMQPAYMQMFRDFGTTLPVLTRIMLSPVTLIIAGVLPMALVAEGVLRRRSEQAQVARCVIAIIGSIGLVVGFVAAIYLPMISMAGEIK